MDIKIYGRIKLSAYTFLLCVCTFLLCVGCATKNINSDTNQIKLPEWVLKPSSNSIVGGVGYCAAHVNGHAGQKELAIKRALEDIAHQKGVVVSSITLIDSKTSNHQKIPDTKAKNTSSYQTNQNVKAYIKEIWVHPTTKEMYIYMIAE